MQHTKARREHEVRRAAGKRQMHSYEKYPKISSAPTALRAWMPWTTGDTRRDKQHNRLYGTQATRSETNPFPLEMPTRTQCSECTRSEDASIVSLLPSTLRRHQRVARERRAHTRCVYARRPNATSHSGLVFRRANRRPAVSSTHDYER
jgi:hypothetical protein